MAFCPCRISWTDRAASSRAAVVSVSSSESSANIWRMHSATVVAASAGTGLANRLRASSCRSCSARASATHSSARANSNMEPVSSSSRKAFLRLSSLTLLMSHLPWAGTTARFGRHGIPSLFKLAQQAHDFIDSGTIILEISLQQALLHVIVQRVQIGSDLASSGRIQTALQAADNANGLAEQLAFFDTSAPLDGALGARQTIQSAFHQHLHQLMLIGIGRAANADLLIHLRPTRDSVTHALNPQDVVSLLKLANCCAR